MRATVEALCGIALLLILSAGLLGASVTTIPATGLVLAPTLLWIVARHRLAGLRLLWGALRGSLAMESWPEAREVVCEVRRFGLLAGAVTSAASTVAVVGFAPDVLGQVGLQVILHAAGPILVAGGLALALWGPLERALDEGYDAWLSALREALTPMGTAQAIPKQARSA